MNRKIVICLVLGAAAVGFYLYKKDKAEKAAAAAAVAATNAADRRTALRKTNGFLF